MAVVGWRAGTTTLCRSRLYPYIQGLRIWLQVHHVGSLVLRMYVQSTLGIFRITYRTHLAVTRETAWHMGHGVTTQPEMCYFILGKLLVL
jgi:hypothetical protein